MLSLDPRMTPQEMKENVYGYLGHSDLGELVSIEDLHMVISRLQREIEDHKATKLIQKRSDEKIAAFQTAARHILDLPF